MRSSTIDFFYQEGRCATPAILTAPDRAAELWRQYGLTLKALGRKRRKQSTNSYRAFVKGYRDTALRNWPGARKEG